MRRSQSLRKAIYALVVLVIFMAFLRISQPASSPPIPAAPDKNTAIVHHNEKPVEAAKPVIATPAAAPKQDIQKPQAESPVANAVSPPDAANKGDTGDADKSEYDAKKAFDSIVLGANAPPVVIFSKSRCPHSMRAKKLLLEAHNIKPSPKVVELDEIDHGTELQQYIGELTDRHTVPNVLVNGVSRGGASDMVELGDSLVAKFTEWGAGKLTITEIKATVQDA